MFRCICESCPHLSSLVAFPACKNDFQKLYDSNDDFVAGCGLYEVLSF